MANQPQNLMEAEAQGPQIDRQLAAQEAIRMGTQQAAAKNAADIAKQTGESKAMIQQRIDLAPSIGLKPGTREYEYFTAEGKLPQTFALESKPVMDSDGNVVDSNFDRTTGQHLDADGNVIKGAQPVTAGMITAAKKPVSFTYVGPGGKPALGWKMGLGQNAKVYNQDFSQEIPNAQPFESAEVTKTTSGSTEHIDSVTGQKTALASTHTSGPSASGTTPSASASSAPTADDATREAAYQMKQDRQNITGTTRTMIETAPRVIDLANRVHDLVVQQQATLGPAASRWQEFMAGTVGAPNPEFTALRTDVGLLQTLLMRMHVGARGGTQIMQHFQGLLDSSKQSPENLLSSLGEITSYAKTVAMEGAPDTRPVLGKGGLTPPPSTGDSSGHTFTFNGKQYSGVPDALYKKYKGKPGFSE